MQKRDSHNLAVFFIGEQKVKDLARDVGRALAPWENATGAQSALLHCLLSVQQSEGAQEVSLYGRQTVLEHEANHAVRDPAKVGER